LADYSIAALHVAPKSSTIDHGRIISPSGNQKRFWRDLAKRKGHRYLKSDEQVHQSKPFFFYGVFLRSRSILAQRRANKRNRDDVDLTEITYENGVSTNTRKRTQNYCF
jgi:hypothetical protein